MPHTAGPQHGRKLGVQNSFATLLMALHPVEKQNGGIVIGENLLDLGGIPPEAGFGQGGFRGQRILKTARVGRRLYVRVAFIT